MFSLFQSAVDLFQKRSLRGFLKRAGLTLDINEVKYEGRFAYGVRILNQHKEQFPLTDEFGSVITFCNGDALKVYQGSDYNIVLSSAHKLSDGEVYEKFAEVINELNDNHNLHLHTGGFKVSLCKEKFRK